VDSKFLRILLVSFLTISVIFLFAIPTGKSISETIQIGRKNLYPFKNLPYEQRVVELNL
jgi:hypothetical protein